jgi:hypothetical protein
VDEPSIFSGVVALLRFDFSLLRSKAQQNVFKTTDYTDAKDKFLIKKNDLRITPLGAQTEHLSIGALAFS